MTLRATRGVRGADADGDSRVGAIERRDAFKQEKDDRGRQRRNRQNVGERSQSRGSQGARSVSTRVVLALRGLAIAGHPDWFGPDHPAAMVSSRLTTRSLTENFR